MPCPTCSGTGQGPVALGRTAFLDYALADQSGEYDLDTAAHDAEKLARIFGGWLHTYGADPHPQLRVVAPEMKLAVPVRGPSGAKYAPRTWVVADDRGGLRVARTGEAHVPGARAVRWPLYQTLTLDAMLQHRDSGALYVYECKTAASPQRRMQSVSVDPQVQGYIYSAQQIVSAGLIAGVDRHSTVAGYVYDVLASGYQSDPKVLKADKVQQHDADGLPLFVQSKANGGGVGPTETRRKAYLTDADGDPILRSPGLSRNEKAGVPSWRYRAALVQHGFDVADYEDHLLNLMASVDPRLYVREEATSGPEVGARYARELYTVAQQLAGHRRKAAELRNPEDRDRHFPRQPVCIAGYGCAYRAPCLQDGDLVRKSFTVADPVRWLPDANENNDGSTTAPEEKLGW
jgi:hypothetical protein